MSVSIADETVNSTTNKWNWKMDYCLKKRWPPSNSYFWEKAEHAYLETLIQRV